MSEIKLLPCPFCGGEAVITFFVCDDEEWKDCVHCRECSSIMVGDTKEEVIKSWNTRKPMERIIERLTEEMNNIPIQYENNYEKGFDNGIGYSMKIVREEGGIE